MAAGYADSSVLFWDLAEAARAHKDARERKERALEAEKALKVSDIVTLGPAENARIEREAVVAEEAERQARPGPPQVREPAGEMQKPWRLMVPVARLSIA